VDGLTVNGGEMTSAIDTASTWIAEQVRRHQFAEVVIRVIIHDGEIKQIERTVTEKIRPEN